MNRKLLIALAVTALLVAVNVLVVAAVSGAAFTTFNPWVDGLSKDICKNSLINCNIYGAKPYVWLNGGPAANGLRPAGEYFFAVLVPGGQPNPNDGSPKNLSDDYDTYLNRVFTVGESGEVVAYSGTHWLDSGNTLDANRPVCKDKKGCLPDGEPPLIRLYPFADTTNPGGVYILAICSLEDGYPVSPRDCKYDAFKVKEVPQTIDLMLSGIKFEDLYADGVKDVTDPGLEGWHITVTGTDFFGMPFFADDWTDENGYWEVTDSWTYTKTTVLVNAKLTVCEDLKTDWFQSFPVPSCYDLELAPAEIVSVSDLDFGNYQKVDVTGCKENKATGLPVEGWAITLTEDGVPVDTQYTGADGCYTWEDLMPGISYDLHEEERAGWMAMGPVDVIFPKAMSGDTFSHTFVNMPLEGCTPGFWQGGTDGGQAGGKWLWNEMPDPQWMGTGPQPFYWDTPFAPFFYDPNGELAGVTMFMLVDGGGTDDVYLKAGRSLVAAYLNASWGMAYAYTPAQLKTMWQQAYDAGTLLDLHTMLDAANNHYWTAEGSCPISASLP